jgi:hypothetical protein
VRRRLLLKLLGWTYGVSSEGPRDTDRAAPREFAGRTAARRSDDADGREVTTDHGVSLRALGEEMDPVRPARALRGHGVPYGRGAPTSDDPDGWSGDASYLRLKREVSDPAHRGVAETVAKSGAYDFGLAHRRDKGLVETHRYAADGGDGGRSLREVVDRHRTGTECKWLVYNTWLAPGQVFGYGFDIPNSDRRFRKDEIGAVVRRFRYDVALLCEVFHGTHVFGEPPGRAIRANAGTVVDYRRGPDRGTDLTRGRTGKLVDSGLLALVLDNSARRTPRVVDHARGTFDALTGQDVPANKGWVFVELDLGPGNVDVFLTHANSQHADLEAGETPGKHQRVRKQNVRTVLDAVETHASPENVTVVCGDLNVRDDFDEYDWLLRTMAAEGLHDLYLTRGGVETSTSYYDISDSAGTVIEALSSLVEELEGSDRYPPNCRRHGARCHCDDYVEVDPDATRRGLKYRNHSKRLDYVFVEGPRPTHELTLDITRVNRRIFPRYGPTADSPGDPPRCGPTYATDVEDAQNTSFLSDHMGLEFHTVASPRTRSPRT